MPVRFNSSDSLRADKPRTDGALQVDDSGPYDSGAVVPASSVSSRLGLVTESRRVRGR
jgi:hypothetical protein